MKKSRKLRYLKRPLAAILALTLAVGGISYTPPTAEAATKSCECQSGLKDDVHKIPKGKTIEQWVKDNASNLEKWENSGTGDTHAHLLQKGDQLLLAWFTTANIKKSGAHYRTVGYHVSDSRYSAGSPSNPSNTSFRKGDGRDLMEVGDDESQITNPEGKGFTQIRVPYDSGRRRADLMIVNYNKVVDICEKMGVKPREENGVYGYHVYFHGYISVFEDANENKDVCNAANNYSSVISAMGTVPFDTSNYPDILQRYNIRFNIPAVVMPVKLRIMTPSQEDNEYLEYTLDSDGKINMIDTGLYVTGKSALNAKGNLTYNVDLDLKKVINQIESAGYLTPTYDDLHLISDSDDPVSGTFSGCHVKVENATNTSSLNGKKKNSGYDYANSLGVYFDYDAMLEAAAKDELDEDTKYEIFLDERDKKTLLTGKVSPTRLVESIKTSCKFEGVQKDYFSDKLSPFRSGDVCFVDLVYTPSKPIQYKYEVTRTIASYDPETKKYYGMKSDVVQDLVGLSPIEEDNITNDNQFTLTLGKKKYPDYAEGSKNNALGCVEYEGHKYVLAKSKLSVKPDGAKLKSSWYNIHKKAEGWAASDAFERVGGNYAYNTTAFNTALSSYRYYTDSNVIPKYGDSATWTVNNLYVCRPPLVQLNYEYNKETDSYKLLDTIPASLASSDSLAYEFAKDELTKSVPTYKLGKPLQNVRVGTGFVEPYDGLTSYSDNSYPMLNEVVLKKEVVGSDRVQNKLDVAFTMPYDTTYLVCVYGDAPPLDRDTPGYTRVVLTTNENGGYDVQEYTYIEDKDPDATEVTVEFDEKDLLEVGYRYNTVNKFPNPAAYWPSRPAAVWGSKAKDTYKYVGPDTPDLDKNLTVYAIYEKGVRKPGYTRAELRKTETGYKTTYYQYIEDRDPDAKQVTVEFDEENLVDVGYWYAPMNKPPLPDEYDDSLPGTWGCDPKDTYNYIGPDTPEKNQNLVVFAIYEYEEGDVDPPPEKLPEVDVTDPLGMKAFIVNDYKASTSEEYDVLQAIPTSEYLNTYGQVRKYIAGTEQNQVTVTKTYTVLVNEEHYVTKTGSYTDAEGNTHTYTYTEYDCTIPHYKTVERETVYYTMTDGWTTVPEKLTIFNECLTLDEKVTMDAKNRPWVEGLLGHYLEGICEVVEPVVHSGSVSSLDSYASDSSIQAEAESCVGPLQSRNDRVAFRNGEDTLTQLYQSGKQERKHPTSNPKTRNSGASVRKITRLKSKRQEPVGRAGRESPD